MIISVNYTKLPNGKISAYLSVEDKEYYHTANIFEENNTVSRPSNIKYLDSRSRSGCIIIADDTKIEPIINNEVSCLRNMLNKWTSVDIPQDKTFKI